LAPRKLVPLLLIALIWAFANVCMPIALGFLSPFLVAQGLPAAEANRITSLSLYTSIEVMSFGGLLLARSISRLPGIILALAALAAVPLLLSTGGCAATLMIAFGVIVGLLVGPVFALAGTGLQPAERALAMGIVFTTFYVAMAVAPLLAGMARDLAHSPAAPQVSPHF
jgi:hypothetical protein